MVYRPTGAWTSEERRYKGAEGTQSSDHQEAGEYQGTACKEETGNEKHFR